MFEACRRRTDAEYELVDVADYDLPLLDEPLPPAMGRYSKPHTKRWAGTISGFDGFVVVTPEYNHGIPGALKNAIDFLFAEWNNKAAAFVGYGSAGGVRAVEHLRTVMAELMVATVRAQVMLSLRDDFERYADFKPRPFQEQNLDAMVDQLVAWSKALQTTRGPPHETREEEEQHAERARAAR